MTISKLGKFLLEKSRRDRIIRTKILAIVYLGCTLRDMLAYFKATINYSEDLIKNRLAELVFHNIVQKLPRTETAELDYAYEPRDMELCQAAFYEIKNKKS